MSEEKSGEKEYAASQKKIDDAFDRGNLPRSSDLLGGISVAIISMAVLFYNEFLVASIFSLAVLLELPLNSKVYFSYWLIDAVFKSVLLILLMPFVVMCMVSVLLSKFRFPILKVFPKLERLSIFKGFESKFGFSSVKSGMVIIIKIVLFVSPLYMSRWYAFEILCVQCFGGVANSLHGAIWLLFAMVALFLFVVISDYFVSCFAWRNDLRMSRQELIKEQKDQEGDSQVKSQRRRMAIEILAGGGVTAVDDANVLIVNPSHYSVAIGWNKDSRKPPMLLAKGVDEVAFIMRERAFLYNIPQYRDPVASRAIYSTVKVGKPVGRAQYRAVASAIRFASAMRGASK